MSAHIRRVTNNAKQNGTCKHKYSIFSSPLAASSSSSDQSFPLSSSLPISSSNSATIKIRKSHGQLNEALELFSVKESKSQNLFLSVHTKRKNGNKIMPNCSSNTLVIQPRVMLGQKNHLLSFPRTYNRNAPTPWRAKSFRLTWPLLARLCFWRVFLLRGFLFFIWAWWSILAFYFILTVVSFVTLKWQAIISE